MKPTKEQQKHLDKLYFRAIDLQCSRAAVPCTAARQPEWDRLHEEYLKVMKEIDQYLASMNAAKALPASEAA